MPIMKLTLKTIYELGFKVKYIDGIVELDQVLTKTPTRNTKKYACGSSKMQNSVKEHIKKNGIH